MVDASGYPHTLQASAPPGKISVGRVVAQSFATVGLALVPFYAVSLGIAAFGLPAVADALAPGNPALHIASIAGTSVKMILSLVAQAALVQATMQLLSDGTMRFGEASRIGLRRVLPYLGASIILILGIVLGMALLVVPGIILACVYGLSPVISILEREGPIASQSRSRALTRNNRWRVLCVSMLYYVLPTLLFGGLGIWAGMQGNAALTRSATFQIVSLAYNVLALPLYVTFPVSLYHQLRQVRDDSGPRGISGVFD